MSVEVRVGRSASRAFSSRGDLDLRKQSFEFDIEFVDCVIAGSLRIAGVWGRSLDLSGTRVAAVEATNLRLTGDFVLRSCRIGRSPGEPQPLSDLKTGAGDDVSVAYRIDSRSVSPALRLTSAQIGGDLVLDHAVVASPEQWALYAGQIRVGGSVQASGLRSNGSLYARDSRIGGSIILQGAEVGGVDATSAEIRLGFLAGGFRSTGDVRLRSATAGVVTFHDAEVGSLNLSRLRASRLRLSLRTKPAGRVVLRDASLTP